MPPPLPEQVSRGAFISITEVKKEGNKLVKVKLESRLPNRLVLFSFEESVLRLEQFASCWSYWAPSCCKQALGDSGEGFRPSCSAPAAWVFRGTQAQGPCGALAAVLSGLSHPRRTWGGHHSALQTGVWRTLGLNMLVSYLILYPAKLQKPYTFASWRNIHEDALWLSSCRGRALPEAP